MLLGNSKQMNVVPPLLLVTPQAPQQQPGVFNSLPAVHHHHLHLTEAALPPHINLSVVINGFSVLKEVGHVQTDPSSVECRQESQSLQVNLHKGLTSAREA